MGLLGSLFGGKKSAPVSNPAELVKQEDLTNRANIESAFGGRTITKDPSGRTAVNIQETPFQQRLRGLQEKSALGLFSGDFGREETARNLFERSLSQLEPERERQRKELETSLSLKGIPIGSEGFNLATQRLGGQQSEELRQLALQSQLAGGQEARSERASQLGLAGADITGSRGFLQGLSNLPSIDVSGVFQQADALNLQRTQIENQRRQSRFDAISGIIGGAFAPKGSPTSGASGLGAGLSAIAGSFL